VRQTTGVQPTTGVRGPAASPRPPLVPRAARTAIVVLAGACATVMALIAAQVADQPQPGWLDNAIDGGIRLGRSPHDRLLSLVATLGAPVSVIVIAVIVATACLLTRRYRGAFLVAIAVPAIGLTDIGLKPVIDRTISGSLSYPSGHTMGAFALATTMVLLLTGPLHPPLSRRARVLLAIAAVLVACFVSYSLIALRMHYFTDTAGGATLAIAMVLAAAVIIDLGADRWNPAVKRKAGGAAPASGSART
jgi:membrane-associated phospholipid phosphatase